MTSRRIFTTSSQFHKMFISFKNGLNVAHYSSSTIQMCDRNITNDISKMFFSGPIQEILVDLTHVDVQKAFRKRLTGQNPSIPMYKFMTTSEINKLQAEIKEKAKKKLQMPPIVPLRKDLGEVLNIDKDIVGFDNSKYLFTDITFGVSDKSRIIVVREPDGTLRKANANERHTANQIYFPQAGKELKHPVMFKDENLLPLLENGDYEFILDRACCQYEPDDLNYHNVVFTTYKHIDLKKKYSVLESTRHIGPLLFYLALNKKTDNFLIYCFETDRLDDAINFIKLYSKINKTVESEIIAKEKQLDFIKDFINNHCQDKTCVEAAFNNCISIYSNAEHEVVN
ncbi:28S ribosomal protein S22, mitochondrial [Daktulosphaira vitifoliae]|uniref:28S ribosomal protein S22, mitochondrial n=1 Tax=Daktulosphaira vitifoliae TaxID=58002 RepID=UPI0021AACD47|nr:28S ribosomal protein S22, mitochondrial [Daktulosphaira vitifoliae]